MGKKKKIPLERRRLIAFEKLLTPSRLLSFLFLSISLPKPTYSLRLLFTRRGYVSLPLFLLFKEWSLKAIRNSLSLQDHCDNNPLTSDSTWGHLDTTSHRLYLNIAAGPLRTFSPCFFCCLPALFSPLNPGVLSLNFFASPHSIQKTATDNHGQSSMSLKTGSKARTRPGFGKTAFDLHWKIFSYLNAPRRCQSSGHLRFLMAHNIRNNRRFLYVWVGLHWTYVRVVQNFVLHRWQWGFILLCETFSGKAGPSNGESRRERRMRFPTVDVGGCEASLGRPIFRHELSWNEGGFFLAFAFALLLFLGPILVVGCTTTTTTVFDAKSTHSSVERHSNNNNSSSSKRQWGRFDTNFVIAFETFNRVQSGGC